MSDYSDEHDENDKSVGGMDYDDHIRERAQELGGRLAEGPEVLFEEIERLIPDQVKQQVVRFPLAAVVIGVGVGVYLGMRKGDELIAAASAMVTAAATANLNAVLGNLSRE